jgi:hypothetical protein
MWSLPLKGSVVRVAWVVAGRTCGLGRGLETGMEIVRELEETRLLIPSRSKEERERCMADMSGTGRWRAVNYHS